MPSMSYCMYENLLNDLGQCIDHLEDDVSESEFKARAKMIRIFARVTRDIENGEITIGKNEDA